LRLLCSRRILDATPARRGRQRRGLAPREESSTWHGQGLVEYVVLIGLIAVGVMVAVGLFEDSISNTFGEIGSRISDLP
jgi:Flp pilus assembly pilin Flp